ncbi:MAG: hypothetical protein KDB22_26610 [Planctomycetales bacterium]|nr:hypothetical protein [Planctomycetales bacterium]
MAADIAAARSTRSSSLASADQTQHDAQAAAFDAYAAELATAAEVYQNARGLASSTLSTSLATASHAFTDSTGTGTANAGDGNAFVTYTPGDEPGQGPGGGNPPGNGGRPRLGQAPGPQIPNQSPPRAKPQRFDMNKSRAGNLMVEQQRANPELYRSHLERQRGALDGAETLSETLGESSVFGPVMAGQNLVTQQNGYRNNQPMSTLENVSSVLTLLGPFLANFGKVDDAVSESQQLGRSAQRAASTSTQLADEAKDVARAVDNSGIQKASSSIAKDGEALNPLLRNGTKRFARIPMDLRGDGLVFGSQRIERLKAFVSERYDTIILWDDAVSYGKIDEIAGTISLNPSTATFDVVAHELSHVRFAHAVGKWRGQPLSNFELNLMEAIGYWGTYRKSRIAGSDHAAAMLDSGNGLGAAMAQSAIQALRGGNPAVIESLQKAIQFYGRDYVEAALRFAGAGIAPGKRIPGL